MPMIKCPDCGSSVSDRLSNCPTCGAPIAKKSERYSQFYQKSQTFLPEPRYEEPEERPRRKKFSKSTALSISAIFISFMAFITSFMAIAIASSKPKEVVVEKEVPVYQEVAEKIVSEESGTIGIEAKIVESEPAGIEDFDYELSEDKVLLKKYIGNCETVIIPYFYNVDGSDYLTDLTHFQIGIGNRDAKTVIICEGIADVFDAMFNSCNVDTVYFPKSMNVVYDKTLSYLHPKGEDKIKIYYGGTREEWENIFTKYQGKDIESAADSGIAAADKVNELIGTKYDSSEFEFFFSTDVNDLSHLDNPANPNMEGNEKIKEENPDKEETDSEELEQAKTDSVPAEYKSALKKAISYSDSMNMSKKAIYDQLTSEYGEKFTEEAAQYAIENMEADWKGNALKKARSYQEEMDMSPAAIYDQLISEYGERFTEEEAQYAIDNL